jgi:UDP-N-acetylmuramoylalanine--D-glutamate ligase
MQFITEKNGIKFYDSSIDSTPSRTAATLNCFTKPLTVICGGYDKNLTYEILADALSSYATNVIITGSAAPKILNAIHSLPEIPFKYYRIEDFEEAVKKAASVTPKSGSVVLSPACASFDHFRNFDERGKHFKKIIMEYISGND